MSISIIGLEKKDSRGAAEVSLARLSKIKSVMAGFMPAIHFPETDEVLRRLWKMDHRDEPGDDEFLLVMDPVDSPASA